MAAVKRAAARVSRSVVLINLYMMIIIIMNYSDAGVLPVAVWICVFV
jgi:hypothetical protein